MSQLVVRTLSGYSEFDTDCLGLVMLVVIIKKGKLLFTSKDGNRMACYCGSVHSGALCLLVYTVFISSKATSF